MGWVVTNTPSAEAIALAVKLSGHTHCQKAVTFPKMSANVNRTVCDGCLGDAAAIDHELQLPQRNAALLCAQGVVDAEYADSATAAFKKMNVNTAIDQLREALAAIKTT